MFSLRVFDILLNRTVFVARTQGTVSRKLLLVNKSDDSKTLAGKRPKNQKLHAPMDGSRHEVTQAWADPRYNLI